ncbi:MAG: NAD(P)/FAD-dependent oxidoreductase [Erysipelotrichaceae bacterium]|jgi:NADPH-dependent 2,4-dienoyl-CoA reductase/sulfur reductase-like enzyme|nr:NAD(P)/FAD-dependent oxidoreductase [Erysipelotrichaceae bacterium]
MREFQCDLAIIGSGPAGLACAKSAAEHGVKKIVILERNPQSGGILNQCIHNGFGLSVYKEELTGPEYAYRALQLIQRNFPFHKDPDMVEDGISLFTETMVTYISKVVTDIAKDHQIQALSPKGVLIIHAQKVFLAMGCRERTRFNILTPGTRPAGIFTAGAIQKIINQEGLMPAKEAVIIGSGDIGLIMARRLTLEGAKVKLVSEILPYSSGLTRNIVQCLQDYNIPLRYNTALVDIIGKKRVEAVVVAPVDENRRPDLSRAKTITCDTVVFSVGLTPETDLTKTLGLVIDPATNGYQVDETLQTSLPGFYSGGNVVHVHDLADLVTMESERAGAGLAIPRVPRSAPVYLTHNENLRYIVPQLLRYQSFGPLVLSMRSTRVLPKATLTIISEGQVILKQKREHVTPGEMLVVTLPEVLAQKIGNDLTVNLDEETL